MATRLQNLFSRLRHLLSAETQTPDAALLDRFTRARDGDAFAALVGRHGPMVFGACLRILRHGPDAEDAMQATFFVLARDAARLPGNVNLGGWLHTVAVNLALKARQGSARRAVREERAARADVAANPSPEDSASGGELAAMLDEELARLPAAHRDAIVLCDLQGRTQDEAAELLGRPRGTVSVHLTRGRERLRRRLEARGVTAPSVIAIPLVELPAALASACVQSAVSGVASEPVLRLAATYKLGAFSMKMKLCAVLVVLLSVGLGWAALAQRQPAPVSDTQRAEPAAPPMKSAFLFGESVQKRLQPDEEPRLGIGPIERIDWWLGEPDGKKLRLLNDPKKGRLRVRPVNRTVVLKRDDSGVTLLGPDGNDLFLSLKEGPLATAGLEGQGQITTFAYSPDGKAVLFVNQREEVCHIQIATQKLTVWPIKGVNRAHGVEFSPDARHVSYARYFRKDDFSPGFHQVYVADVAGKTEKKLAEYQDGTKAGFGFLPDGRVGVAGPRTITALDLKTGKEETVAGPWKSALKFRSFGGFNPDGSTLIYDLGGPYILSLYAFDVKARKVAAVKERYLESFQQMVWVRIPRE